ncbi:MAG: hypothetical protein KGL44_06065 [Sphingomonadales bacterium]|nr:hypothetical protein [Sphingomonadales bacterium]
MPRFLAAFVLALLALLPAPALARVTLSFHSFNGSVFIGRWPHTFIMLDGTLDADGRRVHENYGYTAVNGNASVLHGNVKGTIYVEEEPYIASTNTHFSVPISDAQYHAIVAEMARWRDDPGQSYSLSHHNCVHFVARVAEMVGLHVEVPQNLVKRPKAWLNLITRLNPQLGAREVA